MLLSGPSTIVPAARTSCHRAGLSAGKVAMDVDGTAERDEGRDAIALPIGGRLVDEQAALRITGDVHVVPSEIACAPNRIGDGANVIVERALHSAGFVLRCTEVDQEDVDAFTEQRTHRADVGRDVVDLRAHHQRRDEQERRADPRFRPFG